MKLVKKESARGLVELGGVKRWVSLQLMEDVAVGDYLIVHAGFAIQKLDTQEAQKTLSLLRGQAIEF